MNISGEMSEAEFTYRETLSLKAQADVCREFIKHVNGYSLFQAWLIDSGTPDVDKNLLTYCEQLPSFWKFIQDGGC